MRLEMVRADLFGRRVVSRAEDGELTIVELPKRVADDFVSANHYSGSACWASYAHFGVYRGGELIGAVQYGHPMNPRATGAISPAARFGEVAELNRMAFSHGRPDNSATRVLSATIRWLRHKRPEVRWVQSFADERCGKYGVVYQAASFLYLGSRESTFWELDGEWFHNSMFGRPLRDKRGWGTGPKIARLRGREAEAKPHTFRQFRYVRCLTTSARRDLALDPLPYPKHYVADNGDMTA